MYEGISEIGERPRSFIKAKAKVELNYLPENVLQNVT